MNDPLNLTALGDSAIDGVNLIGAALTGREDYKFGDLTRAGLEMAKSTVQDVTGKNITEFDKDGNGVIDAYEFGDITRAAVAKFTGKDDYEFGDISKTVMTRAEGTINEVRDEYFKTGRRELGGSVLRLGVMAVLAFSFVSTCFTVATFVLSWAWGCRVSGALPITSSEQWASCMTLHRTISLGLEPFLLPLRAAAALIFTPRYSRLVRWWQDRISRPASTPDAPGAQQNPLVSSALATAVVFLLVNLLTPLVMLGCGLGISSLLTGVPQMGVKVIAG